MITIFKTAVELPSFCEKHGWRSCFIGGIAAQAWSQARVTRDVALTLLTGFGGETSFIETLLAHYTPRTANAAQFAIRHRHLSRRAAIGTTRSRTVHAL